MFRPRIPVATYRLQFNRQFRFQDAQELVHYLSRLGISDLYASPILKARQGSSHGYDVTDPTRLNLELGSEADFNALVRQLKDHEMGLLLDIVPNHMAASAENPWWMNLLENGLCSPYASFFDIDWSALDNRVLLTILNRPYEQALENQELLLTLEDAGLFIQYLGYKLPLDIKSYGTVFSRCLNTLEKVLGSSHPDFQQLEQLVKAAGHLPPVINLDVQEADKQYQERQTVKESFFHVTKTSPKIKIILLQNIALFNGKKGESKSFELMHNLLEEQAYQLAFWKTEREYINYRRFFDINELIGVRVEESQVFQATHSLILKLVREDKVSGLRIDHIDGLSDPFQYLSRLQQHIIPKIEKTSTSHRFYITVEKILTADEVLPPEWPVFGTTGYDFTNSVNTFFVDSKGAQALDEVYFRFTGSHATFDNIVYEKKKQVIAELFPSEVHALGQRLDYLAHQDERTAGLPLEELTKAITEVSICLPVYRTYVRTLAVSPQDRLYLEYALEEAQKRNPDMDTVSFDFLKRVLTLDLPHYLTSEQKEAWLHLVLRWQQFTGAIVAKGFEDTALYCYNHLVSLNEVGGDPGSAGLSVDDFHRRNLTRLERWPYTLNATSTHDTKRSEDVRARINVLSEIPGEWEKHLIQWHQWNQNKKDKVNGAFVPEPNTEILLYQTLVGAWPFFSDEVSEFKERLKAYMVKAVREAKAFTDWLSPNSGYEAALIAFLDFILENSRQNEFLEDFLQFEKQIAFYGALNSIAQVLLKITLGGVPDFYQGTELWDFSLADPDNRRPVDFGRRRKLLDDLIQQEAQGQQSLVQQVLNSWEDGRLKLYVTYKALNIRKSYKNVFQNGEYIPLKVEGQRQEHVCAFARRKDEILFIVIVPRLVTNLVDFGTLPVGGQVWGDDLLLLPKDTPKCWLNIFTGENLKVFATKKGLALADIFRVFPIALLKGICKGNY